MIGIVTVVYNQLAFVKATIEAVIEKTKKPYIYIIIFNQAPYPGVLEYVRSLKGVILIENKNNVGITRALKQGYELIKDAGIEMMVKVDDDTVIQTDGWNKKFIQAFLTFKNLGILSADIDKGKQVGPSKLTIENGLGIEQFANPCVGGGFTAYPVKLFELIGFFKEFGFYGQEDGEFANRVNNAGLKTGYLQNVKVKHLGRTEESDELYDQWKILYWNKQTPLDYPEWKRTLEIKTM